MMMSGSNKAEPSVVVLPVTAHGGYAAYLDLVESELTE